MAGDGPAAKQRQADVHYRPAQRERRCGGCIHFRLAGGTAECDRVEGPISPAACCDLWRPLKHGARTAGASDKDHPVA